MNQSLYINFAANCHQPKVTVVEQKAPQDNDTNKQSQRSCPSNWRDYLYVEDDTDDKSMDQTEPLTDLKQHTTSTGTWVPQDTHADAKSIVRLPKQFPRHWWYKNKKVKANITLLMICQ